jgi:ABC-2 type transport system permease protein
VPDTGRGAGPGAGPGSAVAQAGDPVAGRGTVVLRRPSSATMLADQVRYANREFRRTPVAAFFTLVFPLSFMVILSAIYGNEVIDESTGLRLAQYTTPVFAVFGAAMACFVQLGIAVAYARATGVLKRLRGTPLPPAIHVAGRIGSAVMISALAVLIMVAVGVVLYDVQIIGAHVPALILSFVVGTACFSALGLAVASVAPTPNAANTFCNASLILLAFISGIFGVGDLPSWMERLSWVFPLRPFVETFSDGFNPYVDASSPDWGALAVMALWGAAGAVIVWRAFGLEPRSGRVVVRGRGKRGADGADTDVAEPVEAPSARDAEPQVVPTVPALDTVTIPGAPGFGAILAMQARYALLQLVRDPMSLLFAVIFPVLLVTFFSSIYGEEAEWGGLPLPQYLAAAFSIYGVATSGMVNLSGTIAEQRSRRVLARLRGTPLPPWAYIGGRILAVLLAGLVTVVLVFAVATLLFSVTLPLSAWPATALAFILATCCFAACGLAIATAVDGPQAAVSVSLSILLPLSFISDIFISIEQMPAILEGIAWFFPLRHAVHAAVTAASGGALDATFWGHLGVVVLWMLVLGAAAWRWFRWEPRQSSG